MQSKDEIRSEPARKRWVAEAETAVRYRRLSHRPGDRVLNHRGMEGRFQHLGPIPPARFPYPLRLGNRDNRLQHVLATGRVSIPRIKNIQETRLDVETCALGASLLALRIHPHDVLMARILERYYHIHPPEDSERAS